MSDDTHDTEGTHDTPDRAYKDDAIDFGKSADTVVGHPSDKSGGEGPGERADAVPKPKGSQADWRQSGSDKASSDGVESRSADPGQGSYGGFKNEGPATPEGEPVLDDE